MTHWRDLLDPDTPDGAYLPWKRVEARVGISRTTAWRMQRTDDFPKPCVLSPGRVGYTESEIAAWKASRGHRNAIPPQAAASAPSPSAPPPRPLLPLVVPTPQPSAAPTPTTVSR